MFSEPWDYSSPLFPIIKMKKIMIFVLFCFTLQSWAIVIRKGLGFLGFFFFWFLKLLLCYSHFFLRTAELQVCWLLLQFWILNVCYFYSFFSITVEAVLCSEKLMDTNARQAEFWKLILFCTSLDSLLTPLKNKEEHSPFPELFWQTKYT